MFVTSGSVSSGEVREVVSESIDIEIVFFDQESGSQNGFSDLPHLVVQLVVSLHYFSFGDEALGNDLGLVVGEEDAGG